MRDGDISPIGHAVPHIKSDEIVDEAVARFGLSRAQAQVCRPRHGNRAVVAAWAARAAPGLTIDDGGRVIMVHRNGRSRCGHLYGHAPGRRPNELKIPRRVESTFAILDTGESRYRTPASARAAPRVFSATRARLAARHARGSMLLGAASNGSLGMMADGLILSALGAVESRAGACDQLCGHRESRRADRVAAMATSKISSRSGGGAVRPSRRSRS